MFFQKSVLLESHSAPCRLPRALSRLSPSEMVLGREKAQQLLSLLSRNQTLEATASEFAVALLGSEGAERALVVLLQSGVLLTAEQRVAALFLVHRISESAAPQAQALLTLVDLVRDSQRSPACAPHAHTQASGSLSNCERAFVVQLLTGTAGEVCQGSARACVRARSTLTPLNCRPVGARRLRCSPRSAHSLNCCRRCPAERLCAERWRMGGASPSPA